MNRVVKPQTTRNDSVRVFGVYEQGRDAADHSADVIYTYDQYDSTVHMSEATQCYHNMQKRTRQKKFLGRPQTAMNNSVGVFRVYEQGREAADDSAGTGSRSRRPQCR